MDDLISNLADFLTLEDAHSKFYNVVFSDAHRDLYDRIFDSCSTKTMLRLGRVGKLSHAALKDYMKRAFDANKHFRRFFADPLSFRQLQAATNLVVSGSNALQFMNRCIYPGSDMDLYVNVQNSYTVCQWMIDPSRMYAFDPSAEQDADFGVAWNQFMEDLRNGRLRLAGDGFHDANTARGLYGINRVLAIFSFIRASIDPQLERKVQVVVTERSPLVSILNFHSSELHLSGSLPPQLLYRTHCIANYAFMITKLSS